MLVLWLEYAVAQSGYYDGNASNTIQLQSHSTISCTEIKRTKMEQKSNSDENDENHQVKEGIYVMLLHTLTLVLQAPKGASELHVVGYPPLRLLLCSPHSGSPTYG